MHKEVFLAAAVTVIATCGYFVYDDIRTKQIVKARLEYRNCLHHLEGTKEAYESTGGDWDNHSMEQRHAFLVEKFGHLVADVFVMHWEECGPI